MRRLKTVFFSLAILTGLWTLGQQELFAQPIGELLTSVQTLEASKGVWSLTLEGLGSFIDLTGFANLTLQHLAMIITGCVFLFLGIRYKFEPLLLVPIGVGVIIGNIPFVEGNQIGIYEEGSVLNYLYFGVKYGVYPPLIFLGIGAMTDFSTLIANPKLLLLGAAAQIGVFATFFGAISLGFSLEQAGAIGIIGGADGPTAIFLASKLAPELLGAIAIAAYSYMALVPVIQPPLMKLLISKEEAKIHMKQPRVVSSREKILFPIIGLILTTFLAPSAIPLLGMLFFGNILKESGVTERLANTARTSMIDIVTILLGVTVGASTQANKFLTLDSIKIFVLGAVSFMVATCCGLLFAKFMNLFLKGDRKINPLIGAAGVSAVPDSARVVQHVGLQHDSSNHLLMHAMAPNVAGVIGSAIAAGVLMSFLL
ncbi:sodium ion-translocating decarboxylase subunit beta [Sediminitomix flava]|uniref:Oxaloacetate decarboxylase beta subunit n=1 Tax=Sediminitomix flava TaxID=379075 RepID=A0A315Z983_SEDFL|nr:sodium ion-translocating decarboxylase subunit beta [Sediminitomix flava]PWJ42125.1 oxaloacetate decarboxylase beta subunit [Sediminitomix flava]